MSTENINNFQKTIDDIIEKYEVDTALIISYNDDTLNKIKEMNLKNVEFLKVPKEYISHVTKDDDTVLVVPHFTTNRLLRVNIVE